MVRIPASLSTMLKVDLGQLERKGRIRIDVDVAADDSVWDDLTVRLAGPVEVTLDVQKTGPDVLVRGDFRARVHEQCRRCLQPLVCTADDEVTLVYQRGLSDSEAEAREVYTIGSASQEVDLGPALREHLLLAAAGYPVCDESCRGMCASCGTNLNDGSCGCGESGVDPRWAALRGSKK
jgi:uncharacterized protein